MHTINDIKKDLYRSKANATLSHYCAGKLYYNFPMSTGEIYQFGIPVTEKIELLTVDINEQIVPTVAHQLSSDLGSTAFWAEIKASELIRWIAKVIDTPDFICTNRATQEYFEDSRHAHADITPEEPTYRSTLEKVLANTKVTTFHLKPDEDAGGVHYGMNGIVTEGNGIFPSESDTYLRS